MWITWFAILFPYLYVTFGKKPSETSFYWMQWINKHTALLGSNKGKIAMTIFHWFQRYLVTYLNFFSFLFTLVKFDINSCDVSNNCITNLHTNLACLALAKVILALDETGFLIFKDVG